MSEPWIQTVSGYAFPVLDPKPGDIRIEDIAHALSHICRFGGHTREFYSVAQHSVLVSNNVPATYALAALLHDAPEAYIGDMTRPLKHSGRLQGFKEIEDRVWMAIAWGFGLPWKLPACIKEADNRALFTERRDLLSKLDPAWGESWAHGVTISPAFNDVIEPLSPRDAKQLFIERYLQLTRRPDEY